MDPLFLFNVVMRWLHVASAVVAVGATVTVRFVLLPLGGPEVVDRIRPGLKKLVHAAIGLLLVTGLYNYIAVAVPRLRALRDGAGAAASPLAAYHPVMGVKILLSLALFTVATLLLVPVRSFGERRRGWMTVSTVIGLAILLLGAFLRRIWP